MRISNLVLAAALAVATVGCGSNDLDADEPATTVEQEASGEEEATEGPAEEETPATGEASATPGGGTGAAQVLMGRVGTPENPDAFVIELTDGSGQDVTSLPAGQYQIQVDDPSQIHNFHLTGEGVDEQTTVPGTGEETWTVDLQPGTYEAVCDPHPNMQLSFTVT